MNIGSWIRDERQVSVTSRSAFVNNEMTQIARVWRFGGGPWTWSVSGQAGGTARTEDEAHRLADEYLKDLGYGT